MSTIVQRSCGDRPASILGEFLVRFPVSDIDRNVFGCEEFLWGSDYPMLIRT